MFQALVEITTESQSLKIAWEDHIVEALVEVTTKNEGLNTVWQSQSLQRAVELFAKIPNIEGCLVTPNVQASG